MGHSRGRRTQSERDAITVEIGYALASAVFAAAVLFGVLAGPALLFDLPTTVEKVLLAAGTVLAATLFFLRVISVLVRFRQGPQPSQPGRTRPDS
ncbi:DUF6332 family protein [Streptomyces sp. NPDC057621]|uniref:Uncharacterized protein n=1 Tax=Streptomyces liliiviolaceus TaxID=2823109 RepID=A0A940Y187_9ACTN|nr:DUF6332 family protein [Streptomyces liliiviolaceus]MBQ0853628.1 hypothetical protein [Streptomyces liliiviolaceus]